MSDTGKRQSGNALPRVAVIGAGSSGITAVKALAERDIPFDCFESGQRVGGNWCFRNSNGRSAAYESLHINTDAQLMSYADYPMPDGTPHFPGHRIIQAYFEDYVRRFGLSRRIEFETTVTQAKRDEDGGWTLTLNNSEQRRYDALIVANGHHWDPRWPEPPYPGTFDGVQIHSHAYINPGEPVDCSDRTVLVVGMGNSAMDIASELGRPGLARRVLLSARNGVWVMPKYLFGMPLSRLAKLPSWVPWQINSFLVGLIVRLNAGLPWKFGLPRPEHRILSAHPTISSEILPRLGSGDVLPRAGIERLDGLSVRFSDGRADDVDVIIWCTGYHLSFPFFDPQFLAAPGNEFPLWQHLLRPGIDSLFFLGLMQPLGAIMPIAEAQAKLIGDHLLGRVAFPDKATMQGEMARERTALHRRYRDGAARHTMQVDMPVYMDALARIRRRGTRAAARSGKPLPVAARVDTESA